MALAPSPNAHVLIDKDTGELFVVVGNPIEGEYEILGPRWDSTLLRDREGNETLVNRAGRLHVIEASGLPQFWTDAAANADDSYANLGVASKDCTRCSLYVETNDAIVSFDGGATDHHFVDTNAGLFILDGLDIKQGSTISGKNAIGGADYTNLRIAIW